LILWEASRHAKSFFLQWPFFLKTKIPVDTDLGLAVGPVLEGVGVGLGMALLFACLPLLAVRRVSPLLALRSPYQADSDASQRDPWRWVLYGTIVTALTLFALGHTRQWQHGLGVIVGLATAFALLSLAGWALTRGVRRFFPGSWNYVWRQGLANLYRPHNQTLTLILALGLGTFLITTLYLLQTSLLENIETLGGDEQPNMILFDIQSDQRQAVTALVDSFGLPIIEQVPVVAMRLARIKGRDSLLKAEDWALAREYRSTYRAYLTETETVVAGQWNGQVKASEDSVFISMDQSLAANLDLELGDELVFDVQGVAMVTYIGSLRSVDWKRIRPNFLIVFPTGVLEPAPQFHVVVTRTDSKDISAALQRQTVRQFPNVSI
jgi:putative ABC transport system permease protein